VTLTLSPDLSVPLGDYTFTVTGTSGDLVHTAQARLSVVSYTVYLPSVVKSYAGTSGSSASRPYRPGQVDPLDNGTANRALFVGISDYAQLRSVVDDTRPPKKGDLGTAGKDAEDEAYTFATGGGFDEEDTETLTDRQASKGAIADGIVNEMAGDLAQAAHNGVTDEQVPIVVFAFSGHGMQAPDDDGDEADGMDEFIVPYDIDVAGGWAPGSAIRDDELDAWLDMIPSTRIVVIIDACFSGGMAQAVGDGTIKTVTFGPRPDTTAQQWADDFAQDIEGDGRVVLMAAAEDQSSWEFGELGNGVFTYYLLEALRTDTADTNDDGWVSAQEAYTYLAPRVDSYVFGKTTQHQNPQISDGIGQEVDLARPIDPVDGCPPWP
jgi:uncharacterized caspase-like protein